MSDYLIEAKIKFVVSDTFCIRFTSYPELANCVEKGVGLPGRQASLVAGEEPTSFEHLRALYLFHNKYEPGTGWSSLMEWYTNWREDTIFLTRQKLLMSYIRSNRGSGPIGIENAINAYLRKLLTMKLEGVMTFQARLAISFLQRADDYVPTVVAGLLRKTITEHAGELHCDLRDVTFQEKQLAMYLYAVVILGCVSFKPAGLPYELGLILDPQYVNDKKRHNAREGGSTAIWGKIDSSIPINTILQGVICTSLFGKIPNRVYKLLQDGNIVAPIFSPNFKLLYSSS